MSASKTRRPPPAVSAAVARCMRANRGRDTEPELKLRAGLRSRGLIGYRVAPRTLPGRPDVAFTRWKLAIFVHGCFWHHCPTCYPALPIAHRDFWREKFEQNGVRDERRVRQLEALGWEVLEVWECQVHKSLERVLDRVERMLTQDVDEGPPGGDAGGAAP